MEPTKERFVALARSSPWRWSTLRLLVFRSWTRAPFRALVRRPDALRVEALDGSLLEAGRRPPSLPRQLASTGTGAELLRPWPFEVVPSFDADGFVRRRPAELDLAYDDPMLQDYRWVAMLDPVELADGHGRSSGEPEPDPVVVYELDVVDHHGREAWEALVRPTSAYEPRCPCCALLFSAECEIPGFDSGLAAHGYADAHCVTLDVGTGVCVRSEEVGGARAGWGHEVAVEAVDEVMSDGLFDEPRRNLLKRMWG